MNRKFNRFKVKPHRVRVTSYHGRKTTHIYPMKVGSQSTDVTGRTSQVMSQVEVAPMDLTSNITETNVARAVHVPYAQKKESSTSAWEQLQPGLLKNHLSTLVPHHSICFHCDEDGPLFKCMDCRIHACRRCIDGHHSIFCHHSVEWKDGMYNDHTGTVITLLANHSCDSMTSRRLTLVTNSGRFVEADVQLCKCEPWPSTLIRHGYWAGSPDKPVMAVSMLLLEWLHSLTLECQVPAYGFVLAIKHINHLEPSQVSKLQRFMKSESLAQFREFHYALDQYGEEPKVSCPACPKENGQVSISLDGNFGLVLKKKSVDTGKPSNYFIDQSAVDEFVANYNDHNKVGQGECNRFQAGDILRSKNRSAKLHYTGVVGSACKHEIPLLFMNLIHGERLAYPIYLIRKLLESYDESISLNVMYDIGCVLTSHLEKSPGRGLLDKIDLAIPIFHCYGHQASCQLKYSPRRKEGFGLSDGEQMERIWSFVRSFNLITKEQTASHRGQLLSAAFKHYAEKKISTLDLTLVERHNAAEKVYTQATHDQLTLMSKLPVAISEQVISEWNREEMLSLSQRASKDVRQGANEWKQKYVAVLKMYYTLRDIVAVQDIDEGNIEELQTLTVKLQDVERRRGITRWLKNSQAYLSVLEMNERASKINLLVKLQALIEEKSFLIHLRSKYASGQAISGRICRQMNRVGLKVKKLVEVYNKQSFTMYHDLPNVLTADDICSTTAQVFLQLSSETNSPARGDDIPKAFKRQLIDLYNLKMRSSEEMQATREEMQSLISNFEIRVKDFENAIISDETTCGAAAYLRHKHSCLSKLLERAKLQFSHILPELSESEPSSTINYEDLHELLQGEAEQEELLAGDDLELESLSPSELADLANIGL